MKTKKTKAAAIEATLRENVAALVARDATASLEQVLCMAGYSLSYRDAEPAEALGDAILALIPIIPIDRLRSAASTAAFERVFDREGEGKREPNRWATASRAADLAMRGVQAVAS